MHHGLGQSLAIINNRALIGLRGAADPERVAEQLEEISFTASSAIDEVREIAHNLRPHEPGHTTWAEPGSQINGREGLRLLIDPTHLRQVLDEFDGLLPSEAETSIYRIVQDGLNKSSSMNKLNRSAGFY